MRATAEGEEDAEHDRAKARAVPVVVVVGALPRGEAIGNEVVVASTAGALQDVGDNGQAGLAVRSLLDGGLDLGLRGALGDLDAGLLVLLVLLGLGALGGELLLDLVGVEGTGLLAVGFVDIILGGRGGDAEEVVEGDIRTLEGGDLVTKTENLTVWMRAS